MSIARAPAKNPEKRLDTCCYSHVGANDLKRHRLTMEIAVACPPRASDDAGDGEGQALALRGQGGDL